MPGSYRVLIVEDDVNVAYVHRKVVSALAPFTVVGVAETGEEALRLVATRYPHLLLLDLSLAGMGGESLLRKLRSSGNHVETIVVTANRDMQSVRSLVHFGVIDYLAKPCSPERLRQSLTLFQRRMQAIEQGESDQEAIDAYTSSGRRAARLLPRGLDPSRLEKIRAAVAAEPTAVSADDVGESVGMARVTARRYLEYLHATGEATVVHHADGPGRPRKLYQSAEHAPPGRRRG